MDFLIGFGNHELLPNSRTDLGVEWRRRRGREERGKGIFLGEKRGREQLRSRRVGEKTNEKRRVTDCCLGPLRALIEIYLPSPHKNPRGSGQCLARFPPPRYPSRSTYRSIPRSSSPSMSGLKNSLHVLSPGDKSYPHCHSVITGRKSWKTLKGKTEAVWPPYLEVALFEGTSQLPLVISTRISSVPPTGLSRYQPSNPRATKSLGRFPNRNRFISEYILKKTGKHRTPKQVGSRLQQLRDTHQGKQRTCPRPRRVFHDFILFSFPLQSSKVSPTVVSISRKPATVAPARPHPQIPPPDMIIRTLPELWWLSRSSQRVSPNIRLVLPPPTPPPHRLSRLPSQPLLSITPSHGPSLLSTQPSPLPLAPR